MQGLAFKVSYSRNYKGFRRDSYPTLKAKVNEDLAAGMTATLSALSLAVFAGDLRYRQMLGLTGEVVWPWTFRWYEYLDAHIYNQVRAALWLLAPEHMEEEEAWG